MPWTKSPLLFQTHVYANGVRALAAAYCVLELLVVALCPGDAAFYLTYFLVADYFIFSHVGPTPLAPIGTTATAAAWRCRGTPVPAAPHRPGWCI